MRTVYLQFKVLLITCSAKRDAAKSVAYRPINTFKATKPKKAHSIATIYDSKYALSFSQYFIKAQAMCFHVFLFTCC